ncbi:MAG: 3-phosphoshikimate 1-carboxyvinyltransferase [Cyclobacteriaceae bacterium]|jgi:3-phosphoshikimate 1-carboxyvinyltransferase
MKISLSPITQPLQGSIKLSSSKSESNRVLIMRALAAESFDLSNLSDARDTETMQRLLLEQNAIWDVLDAGTTMRFCTALLAINGTNVTITGTDRMKQRPIKLLVDALNKLGASIEYLEEEGYPPLRINKISQQKTDNISIPGNISSQYVSALLMIAPSLPLGLSIQLSGEIFSRPYIDMTLGLMARFGIKATWEEHQVIEIQSQQYVSNDYQVESDWSGASYWYSMVGMIPGSELLLQGLRADSFQGDQKIAEIMEQLGVKTTYVPEGALLQHTTTSAEILQIDFRRCPDLAQTVMVVAAMKGCKLTMTGLESLKIKETDRVAAMAQELRKIGGTLSEIGDTWHMEPGEIPELISAIETYEDHRMAMAFAPIGLMKPITIEEPDVVKKSYPKFWEHLASVGCLLVTQ